MKGGSLEMRLKAARPEEESPRRNAAKCESNDLAIRWTVDAQSSLEAKFGLVTKPLWLKYRSH